MLGGTELTFAGGSAGSSTVTVTAVPDAFASPPTTIGIAAGMESPLELAAAPVSLTITDTRAQPAVSLVVSPDRIAEAGGTAGVTAALDVGSVQEITLSVTVAPEAPALAGDFRQHGVKLTIPARATASSETVTVSAVADDVDAPDGTYAVSAQVTAGSAAAPAAVRLTIADDDDPPRVELQLSKEEIEEDDGPVTVTARLTGGRSGVLTTVRVAVTPVGEASTDDYVLSDDDTLTIAARARESVGTVTITPQDDDLYGPTRTLTVSGTAANARTVTGPAARTLEIGEDEDTPVVTLALSDREIAEAGGAATVTASLDGVLDREVVLAVTATPEARDFAGEVAVGRTTSW